MRFNSNSLSSAPTAKCSWFGSQSCPVQIARKTPRCGTLRKAGNSKCREAAKRSAYAPKKAERFCTSSLGTAKNLKSRNENKTARDNRSRRRVFRRGRRRKGNHQRQIAGREICVAIDARRGRLGDCDR